MSATIRPGTAERSTLFRRVIDEGVRLAETLERGQSEMPLAQHFRSQQRQLADVPFCVCVVGLDRDSRTALLRWLFGQEFSLLSVDASRNLGMLELSLRDHGFVLEGPRASRQEFEHFGSFVQALNEADIVRDGDPDSWVEPLRLGVSSGSGLQALKIMMPESMDVFSHDPSLVNRICLQTNALIVGAPQALTLSDLQRAAIESLAPNMIGIWPVVIQQATDTETLPGRGWWTDTALRGQGPRCAPLVLRDGLAATLPNFLREPQDPVRRALCDILVAKTLQAACDALAERFETLKRQQKMRRQKEERTEKAAAESGTDASQRSQVDALRNFVQDEFSALTKGLQENNRKALLSDSVMMKSVEDVLDMLQITDLSQAPGHKVVQLSVSDSYLAHLSSSVRRVVKEQLSKDLVMMRDGLRTSQEQFSKVAERHLGAALQVEFYSPDERHLREVMGDVLKLQIRYKGEMPKRGFMQRLSEGRRLLFAAIMTLSLFIGLITGKSNARSLLAPFGLLFILVFAAGVWWTFYAWKREDAERLTKEIDRVKEQLRSEVQRLLTEAQREKISRLNEHLEQVRRDVVRRLDEFARQISQQRSTDQTRERQAARERIRLIDQRTKDLDTQRTALQKLEQDCRDLSRECEGAVRSNLQDSSSTR